MYKKLVTCLESVRKKVDFKPKVALILGSGLGDFADGIKIEQTIDYTEIEGFPVSTVKGHTVLFDVISLEPWEDATEPDNGNEVGLGKPGESL